MRAFIIIIFMCLYAMLTFFGLGPALFADGTSQERIVTIAIVVILYILLTLVFHRALKYKSLKR